MEQILTLVTTPFAFAALIVLAAAGLVEINKRRSGATAINSKTFWLILIFGVMANVIFVLKDVVFTDTLLRGEIRRPDGRPIPNAVIDVSSIGRTASSDLGTFEISIPHSRTSDKYTVYPFFNGIPGRKLTVTGPTPAFLTIEYETAATISNYLRTHDIVVITQNVGFPVMNVLFRTNGEITGRVKAGLFQVNLKKPNGERHAFLPTFVTRNNMPVMAGDFIVDYENQSAEYLVMTQLDPTRQMQIAQAMFQRHGPAWMGGCMQSWGVDSAAEASLVTHFDDNFFWDVGRYELEVRYRIEGAVQLEMYEFEISESQSAKLKNMRAHLKHCRGVAFDASTLQMLNYSDGTANNAFNVGLKRL